MKHSKTARQFIVAGIPARNEEHSIAKVILLAKPHVDEVIVCDDGSEDLTGSIADQMGARVIRRDKGLGYGSSLRTLFTIAVERGADILVTVDADGQHDPRDIPNIIKPLSKGLADVVIGSRTRASTADMPAYRRLGLRLIRSASSLASGTSVKDTQSGFRAYNRKAIHSLIPTDEGMGASSEILIKASELGLRVTEVPTTIRYSAIRPSTHNPLFQGLEVIGSVIKFTSLRHPLLFYGVVGMLAFLVSVVFGIWAWNVYTTEGRLVTNLTLISLTSLIIAILAIFTGVILYTVVVLLRSKM